MNNKRNIDSPYLSDVISNKRLLPRYLYKHRNFNNKYDVNTLIEKKIWLSEANKFDDPTESTIEYEYNKSDFRKFYDKNFINLFLFLLEQNNIEYSASRAEIESFKKECFTNDGKLIKSKFKKIFIDKGADSIKIKEVINKIEEIRNYFLQQNEVDARNHIKTFLKKINDSIAKVYTSCSFTECNNNQRMWAGYSNYHTGFLIEYDVELMAEDIKKSFVEIKYGNKPEINIFDIVMLEYYNENNIIPNEFINDFVNNLITKDIEWKDQKEWRFIPHQMPEGKTNFPFINAIYLGYKIEPENRDIILTISKNENYKIYNQIKDSITGKMIYERIK